MAAGFTARTQKPGAGTRASQARDEGRHHLEIHIPRDALGVTRGQRPFPDEEILREFVASRLTMKEWPKKVLHTERKRLQKIAWNIRRKTTSKIGVRRIDYPFPPEFSKPYLMSAAKITPPSDVVFNKSREKTTIIQSCVTSQRGYILRSIMRQFHGCANIPECTYTNPDPPRPPGTASCSWATHLHSMWLQPTVTQWEVSAYLNTENIH